eukprot:TRINITY_DN11815_c0_g1_i1.p1 TRINITY_DN11815_c0_g1~~TRINITY_DN11815_c0_g1_i1.p1  ORF type:complete len:170 (+),score=1.47 TRINITY_DN11815_c0_g1_i1:73-582(+)
MSARGERATGTDGSDYAFRQTVEPKYVVMCEVRSLSWAAFVGHMIYALLMISVTGLKWAYERNFPPVVPTGLSILRTSTTWLLQIFEPSYDSIFVPLFYLVSCIAGAAFTVTTMIDQYTSTDMSHEDAPFFYYPLNACAIAADLLGCWAVLKLYNLICCTKKKSNEHIK